MNESLNTKLRKINLGKQIAGTEELAVVPGAEPLLARGAAPAGPEHEGTPRGAGLGERAAALLQNVVAGPRRGEALRRRGEHLAGAGAEHQHTDSTKQKNENTWSQN